MFPRMIRRIDSTHANCPVSVSKDQIYCIHWHIFETTELEWCGWCSMKLDCMDFLNKNMTYHAPSSTFKKLSKGPGLPLTAWTIETRKLTAEGQRFSFQRVMTSSMHIPFCSMHIPFCPTYIPFCPSHWCWHLVCIWGELPDFDTKFCNTFWASASQIVPFGN